jgi:hypothetical protein
MLFARPCFEPALARLDLLLHREIARLRASYQLSLDEFRGLYVSDQHVDALVRGATTSPDETAEALTSRATALERPARERLAADARWSHVVREFALQNDEEDALLLALAPELALKYETLFSYLNNDVTRKLPTTELALRLCDGTDAGLVRARLARLISESVLESDGSDESRLTLHTGLSVTPPVASFLLGLSGDDALLRNVARISGAAPPEWDELVVAPTLETELKGLAEIWSRPRPPWAVFEGARGSGRGLAARIALGAASKGSVAADLSTAIPDAKHPLGLVPRLVLQARLRGAGLVLGGIGRLMAPESRDGPNGGVALEYLARTRLPVVFSLEPELPWRTWLPRTDVVRLHFGEPDAPARARLWHKALHAENVEPDERECADVADRFALNGGQIRAAAAALKQRRTLSATGVLDAGELFRAAREQSTGQMGKLSQKLERRGRFSDLVLPAPVFDRIEDVTSAIRNRSIVYRDWGMHQRIGGGMGLLILFSGPSGTGKTMTAALIGERIGLDVYRIDLAAIVSKYIGETEKNLDRIFDCAHRSNCILFFDEADALFGKRSEVKDAHDRYANIEVAYLLQKIEVHEGVVILASNLAENLDQAFSRRVHYSIEFPRPDAAARERLWRGMFPASVPLAPDVDFSFLARQFDATGGEIKTMALDAALRAAGNGGRLGMPALVKAVAHQLMKQGRIPSASDFKQYFPVVSEITKPRPKEERPCPST